MAAAVIPSLSVPRSRPGLAVASAASAPISAAFGRRGPALLPASVGLRIAAPKAMTVAPASGAASRRRSVVCEAQETTTIEVPDVTKATWQSLVLECDKPVLVEFWASWCGPCRMIDPVIGKLSKIYEGKLQFFKLNTDDSQDIATQYGIRSIPTIMIFKNGEKKDAVIGAVPENTLVTCIEKFV